MLPKSVAVLPCHLGWPTLLKCNKTNHACLSEQVLTAAAAAFVVADSFTTFSKQKWSKRMPVIVIDWVGNKKHINPAVQRMVERY